MIITTRGDKDYNETTELLKLYKLDYISIGGYGGADLEGKLTDQTKYVVLNTFYDDGVMATIDIARLPFSNHKTIVSEYLKEILMWEISRDISLKEAEDSRFMLAGGHLLNGPSGIEFSGTSGDFGHSIIGFNVNAMASFLAYLTDSFDVSASEEQLEEGKNAVLAMFELMEEKEQFYDKLAEYIIENSEKFQELGGSISPVLLNILYMKSIDRAGKEGIPFEQAVTFEMTEGIGRNILSSAIRKHMNGKND